MSDTTPLPGWKRLEDGDPAPEIGGPALSQRRRAAIEELLRMMACTHGRGVNCEHVEAIAELGGCMASTTLSLAHDGIRDLVRPLTIKGIEKLFGSLTVITGVSGDETPRGFAS